MFDLRRPCVNCPFRVSVAGTFLLGAERVREIVRATAFQCRRTVAYDHWDDPMKRQGEKPQQCAGLMALLHRAGQPNEIERLRAPAAESARQQALEEAASLVEAAAHDNSSAWFSGLLANLADSIRALAAWNTRPAPAVEAAQQVYDKLKNLLTMEGSRMSGTPMIPLHEETLFEIAEVLTTVPMERAARDILSERRRQVEAEGWTPKHDDEHFLGELAAASGTYALVASGRYTDVAKRFWPWDFQWWKPGTTRRNLVKAGALILAEIERIDRADALAHPEPEEKA